MLTAHQFKQLFPHYYISRFIVGDQEIDFFKDDGEIITVDERWFQQPGCTKFLGIPVWDQRYLKAYGIQKYAAMKNVKLYDLPYHPKTIDVHQQKQRQLEKQKASEKKKQQLIEKQKEEEADAKLWQPRLWSSRGTIPEKVRVNHDPIDILNFQVYVDSSRSFPSAFQKLPTIKHAGKLKDIRNEKFTRQNPYFCSLSAAYVFSYKCGFSHRHFQEKGIAGSLAHYALYYHFKKMLTYPNLIVLSPEDIQIIRKAIPLKVIWKKKFVHTQEIPELWLFEQKNKANMRLLGPDYYADGSGQLGIYYEEIEKVLNADDQTDWQLFIRKESNGFTTLGKKLLQQAIESYVYSILGAQAKTRWDIAGDDAKALQTQDVEDTIIELDATKAITNMRTAIRDTHVRLDLVISPGVSLLPSNLKLTKKIPGFNNILSMATTTMTFGVNKNVNFPKKEEHEDSKKSSHEGKDIDLSKFQEDAPLHHRILHKRIPESNTISYVVTGVIISLLTRLFVEVL